jgi:serine/threonine-protein kinase
MSEPQDPGGPPTLLAPDAAAPLSEVERPRGRYELLALLGAGGMGSVYRALDRELDEVVALKVLKRDLVGAPEMLERFRREVKLARRVTHPNVARTYDIGEHEGERVLTMELVEGEPLARLMRRSGALPHRRVVEIALSLCEGLAAAHAVGVLHRDLKPDNVLLGKDGRVVITDFGLARTLAGEGDASLTRGNAIGTPIYMAPEQLEGRDDIDGRADIFSLGVMLYEMWTGDLPWTGSSAWAVAAVRLVAPPVDPRTHRADLPEAAAQLLLRCLARERVDRFPDVTALATALRALETPAEPAPRTTPTPSPAAPPPSTTSSVRQKTVAVLPFALRGPPDRDYLATGLSEDLVDILSMTAGLRVRPLGAVLGAGGGAPDRDPREVGRRLDVQVVVDGSVRIAGERLQVRARVVGVADGFQLWAKAFDCTAEGILDVSEAVAQSVAQALTVDPVVASRAVPRDPAALDLYLRGRHEYHRGGGVGALRAVDLLQQALAMAPDDPEILAYLALAQARGSFFGSEGAFLAAGAAAERVMQIAPERAESAVASGAVAFHQGDAARAAQLAKEAIRRAPSLADAHELLGRILAETGPAEQALYELSTALGLDPRIHQAKWLLARTHALTGHIDEANRLLDETLSDHEVALPHWIVRARIVAWHRDVETARRLLAHPDMSAWTFPAARRILEMLVSPPEDPAPISQLMGPIVGSGSASPRSRLILHQAATELAVLTGDTDGALAALERAVDAGLIDLLWFELCPALDTVRRDPRSAPIRATLQARARAVHDALGG